MAKTTKAYSGAAKDAYFHQVLEAEPGLAAAPRDALARRLKREVAHIRVRTGAAAGAYMPAPPPPADVTAPAPPGVAFDPYSPNVIVLVRTLGREAASAALAEIADSERLRLLAREQQLGIDPSLVAPDDIRAAIVAAAERRIANRRAAAS